MSMIGTQRDRDFDTELSEVESLEEFELTKHMQQRESGILFNSTSLV